MKFAEPLTEGVLVKRYKRFLADVLLADGSIVTVHTPNTGSMKGCCLPGSRVWLRDSGNTARKYPLSWELVEARPGVIVGINTGCTNDLVEEATKAGVVAELQDYANIRREVRYGVENSRIDLLLENGDGERCFVEVKNVTMVEGHVAYFPDAVSIRGTKHLRELAEVVRQGGRGVIFFCVQRRDATEVRPADQIDPVYGETLRAVKAQGVDAIAYAAEVSPEGVSLVRSLPVVCP